MATKNKSLTYNKEELIRKFDSVISNASSRISQNSESAKNEISKLQSELKELNASKKQLALEIYQLIGNSKISEIEKEAEESEELRDYFELQQLNSLKEMDENQIKRHNLLFKKFFSKTPEEFQKLARERVAKHGSLKNYINSTRTLYSNIPTAQEKINTAEAIENRIKYINERISQLTKKQSANNASIDYVKTFETFLKNNGLSTSHAEEIYNYLYNNQSLQMNKNSFKIRKRHKWRDRIIKKGAIPASITCAGIGAAVAPLATQSLIAGSTAYGFLPVFGSMEMITFAAASMGAVAGLIATPVIIKAKNELTKLHYNLKYKSSKRNLKDYQTGTSVENLHITNLINKIENSKHKILELGQGNWFTKTFKFIPKHVLNTINRNRIHHVEKYTKDLMAIYSNSKDSKLKEQTYSLLQQVDNFVAKDVEESKLHAMLTCKEGKKKHSHKSTIENIDIFANLKIYLDTVDKSHKKKDVKTEEKQAKKTINNIRQKTAVANQILNGERLIPQMIQREKINDFDINETIPPVEKVTLPLPAEEILPSEFIFEEEPVIISDEVKPEEDIAPPAKNKFIPVDRKVVSQVYDGDKDVLTLTLENNKKIELNNAKDLELGTISTARSEKNTYVLTYEDGNIIEVAKTKKIAKEIESARKFIFDVLDNEDEVIEIKNLGYNQRTIDSLKQKLSTWFDDKNSKFSLSGKVYELYHLCLDTLENSYDDTNNV